MLHPLRETIPIFLGAEGPKNVALCAELCDGWLALFFSPRNEGFYRDALAEGFARDGARRSFDDFEVSPRCRSSSTTTWRPPPTCCAPCTRSTSAAWAPAARISTTTSPCASATRRRPSAARTCTWKGARTRRAPRCRRGSVEELALIGPRDKIRHDIEAWRDSIVTTMLVAGSPEMLRDAAELVLG